MTREQLSDAIEALGMSRTAFAATVRVERSTVDGWLAPETAKSHRRVPPLIAHLAQWAVKRGGFPPDFNAVTGKPKGKAK